MVADDLFWDDTLVTLRRYSLIEVSDDALSVQRLVQAITRDRMDGETHRQWSEVAVKLVAGSFLRWSISPSDFQTGRRVHRCRTR